MSRTARLSVIGSLYLVANIGFSFFFLALNTILLSRDVPLGTVALLNLLPTIYFGRFLLAPVVDRIGHYRRWLILTQAGLILTLVALATIDPVAQLPVLVGLMAVVLGLTVCHDTALGGLAVRLVPSADQGIANGIQMASASASMLIGSGGALLLYAHAGWTVTLSALAAVFVIPLAVLTALTEWGEHRPPPNRANPLRELVQFFRRPHMATWTLLVIPLFAAGEWLWNGTQSAMLLSAGWPVERIGLIQSVAATVSVFAALGTGAAITRRRPVAVVIGIAGAAGLAALLPLAAGNGDVPLTATALIGVSIVYGAKLTLISTICMRLARQETAATDYTVPMSIEGIFVTVIGSAGLGIAGGVGFPALMSAAIALAVAGAVVTPLWIHRHAGDPARRLVSQTHGIEQ